MQSLQIAQVMASGPVCGGLEKHFTELCNGLSDRHEVHAIAHPAHAKGMSAEVRFHPLDLTYSRHNPWNLFRLHREIKGLMPDVIHAHANKAAALVATLRSFFPGRKVATVHSYKRDNRVFSVFDRVIAVSPTIHSHLGLPNAEVICNGIPLIKQPAHDPQYFVRQFELSQARPIAVAVGRLAQVKGFAGLIRAWQDIDADLLIVGEGPERAALERLITRLDLNNRVHFTGYRDDVSTIMAHADLVVMSSQREGFPYVMVEALHLEKVIVATSFPGAEQLLPSGYVASYGNAEAFAATIVKALCNLEQAKRDFQATWADAKQLFTVEHMVQQTEAVYEGLTRVAA